MNKRLQFIKSRLYRKILLSVAAVGVIPLILVSLLGLYSLNRFHRIDIAAIEENLVNQKAEEIQSFFREVMGSLELTVGTDQEFIEFSSQEFILRGLLAANSSLEEAGFINLRDIARLDLLEGDEMTRVSRTFPDGVPASLLTNAGHVEKFTSAKKGRTYISPVHYTFKGPMITVSSPVRNQDGKVIAVLAGEINLTDLQEIAARSVLGGRGYLYIVDQDGFIVASSKRDGWDDPAPKDFRSVGFVSEMLRGKKYSGREDESQYISFWNEEVIGAGRYLEDFHMGLVAEWPVEDANLVVGAIRTQNIAASFLVFIITILISIALAARIVDPIRALEAGTELVAQGKFDQPVTIKTADEIEDLGTAFNKMIKGLKRLQELKDEFVFVAAHELRTPVTAIKGYISLALSSGGTPLSEDVKKFLGEVKNASERLNQLVNDLLEIARSEAGRLEIQGKEIEITGEIKSVVSELAPLAKEKSITVTYDPGALPKAFADPMRFKEVMINLVGNAVKYTIGSGAVTITHEVQGDDIVTHIKDTGMGISKEAQSKLFEKFYRVKTEQTQNITGTGLGLFIVKQIIEKMGGKIWVESEEGKGSTFSFSVKVFGAQMQTEQEKV
jgi:signal transduction histidine kinase